MIVTREGTGFRRTCPKKRFSYDYLVIGISQVTKLLRMPGMLGRKTRDAVSTLADGHALRNNSDSRFGKRKKAIVAGKDRGPAPHSF